MYVFFTQPDLVTTVGIETETVGAVIPYIDGSGAAASLVISLAGNRVPVIGAPSYVAGQLGIDSYTALPLVESISGPLPPWGLEAWIRRSGTIPQVAEYEGAEVPATSLQWLGDEPWGIVVAGDPAFVSSAISPPTPGGFPPYVEALILADGTVPYQRNIGGTSHVSGSGDYEITWGADAAGAFVLPALALFGAPVASPLFLSWNSTGPGQIVVYVRDGAGAPVDAPFSVAGIASVVS